MIRRNRAVSATTVLAPFCQDGFATGGSGGMSLLAFSLTKPKS
jgi:hypothetical protein